MSGSPPDVFCQTTSNDFPLVAAEALIKRAGDSAVKEAILAVLPMRISVPFHISDFISRQTHIGNRCFRPCFFRIYS